jgi:drug/metabolite transporter superfamily protein YnfA
MNNLDKMNIIALVSSSLLLSLFTMVSYGHVYKVFGSGIAICVSLFFGIAAVISIFKLIKKAREWQTKRN